MQPARADFMRSVSVDEANAKYRGLRTANALGFAVARFERIVGVERQVRRCEKIADLLNEGENVAHGDSRLNAYQGLSLVAILGFSLVKV